MFSFHKPKVYRSSTGCCICRAKSSSSRFTDSKKYEDDFVDCFQLPEKRCGEVCNACVLLVKRWKKLPEGNGRNWRHVVDARAGPGTKSMTKFKSRNHNRPPLVGGSKRKSLSDELGGGGGLETEPPGLRKRKPSKLRPLSPSQESNGGYEDCCGGDSSEEGDGSSRSPTPSLEEHPLVSSTKRLSSSLSQVSSFIDLTIWKRQKICCGTVFVGPCGAVLVDARLMKSCPRRSPAPSSSPPPPPAGAVLAVAPAAPLTARPPPGGLSPPSPAPASCISLPPPPPSPPSSSAPSSAAPSPPSTSPATTKLYDNSSDSGYDESSNQSLPQPVPSLLN